MHTATHSTHMHAHCASYANHLVSHNALVQSDRFRSEALRRYDPDGPADQLLPAVQVTVELQEAHQRDERAEGAARQPHQGDVSATFTRSQRPRSQRWS